MVKDFVPKVHFYDQDFVDMYDRTWVWLDEVWKTREENAKFEEGFFTHDGEKISLFDTLLSSLFLVYSNQTYSPYSMVDYFYSRQEADGAIRSCYNIADDSAVDIPDNQEGLSLPLFPYVEYLFYHKIGNKKRLKDIVPYLEKYFTWMKRFQDENGLFAVPPAASEMRNLEREGAKYFVDYNAFMALSALYMSNIGDVLNDKELAFKYKRIYFSLKTRINSLMWDSEDGIYYDLDESGQRVKNMHIGAYMTMLAEIPNVEYATKMITKLRDENVFGLDNPFPTVPRTSRYFTEEGEGYRSSVASWITFFIIKGLINYDSYIFARECALRHMYYILDTLHPDQEELGDTFEFYRPSSEGEAKSPVGNRKRFLPSLGLITITLMIENIIGLNISLPKKTVDWTLPVLEEMGIEKLSLKKNNITILANKNIRGWEIRLESEKLYYFTIEILEENKKKTLPIPSGKCSMLIDKL